VIYFIQVDGVHDRVKVGKAHDVKRRMYELSRFPSSAWQTQAEWLDGSDKLVLRACCEGYSEVEAALHRMLAPHHLWGEWFDATAPLVADLVVYCAQQGTQALAHLLPEQHRTDRIRACAHIHLRDAHPDGACLLCELDFERPLVIISAPSTVTDAITVDAATSSDDVRARLMSALGSTTGDVIDYEAADEAALRDEFELYQRALEGEYARRDLAEFFRQAVASGNVHGLTKIQWSPHIEATCFHVQMLLEGWLVTQGCNAEGVPYATEEMIVKQRNAWVLSYGHDSAEVRDQRWLVEPLVQNMIENICPGTLKSTIAMVIANAWIWLHAPHVGFGASSWNEKNVKRDSNATKDLVKSEWYRTTFEIAWLVRGDQDAVELWTNSASGFRLSSPVRSGFTGQHVHMMFIDDPDDADGVWQESNRETRKSKFSNAMENRVVDEITCIRFVLQQRVHLDDMTGMLLAIKRWSPENRKGWAWFVIPLRYGRGPKVAPRSTPYGWSDWRTETDEVMHPARFTLAVILDKMTSLQDVGFAAQYDQNPQVESGGMFDRTKAQWWCYEDELGTKMRPRPKGCKDRDEQPAFVLKRGAFGLPAGLDDCVLSIDATFGSQAKTASNVGLTVHGKVQERILVLEDRTRNMGVQEQYDRIIDVIAEWSPLLREVIVEEKALGVEVINQIIRMLASGVHNGKPIRGLDGKTPRVVVTPITVGAAAGKILRARGASPTWNSGLTYLHDGAAWVYSKTDGSGKTLDDGYFNEIVMCPNGRKMDRVDTFSQMVSYWRDNGADESRARALNTL
jgi:hypothetical protein